MSGVPGAGKTLVGMRAVHARYLDDLAIEGKKGKPAVPGLYLTGNGPLAEVLQYELRKAGGGCRTFVRHIKAYLDRFVPHPDRDPPEHLLVFDEAQRAFSANGVSDTHPKWQLDWVASEPELFIRICDLMKNWSVLVGLIGSGQEINSGKEEGLRLWRIALETSEKISEWTVHVPSSLRDVFDGARVSTETNDALALDKEIRFHRATHLHDYVEALLSNGEPKEAAEYLEKVTAPGGKRSDGLRLYVTRDLEVAKDYLRERYAENAQARFGLLASSRDKDLPAHGIDNSFMATNKGVKIGPWFTEPEEHPESCRHLERVVTEFGCQGLELEMALVAWGTDLMRENGEWTNRKAARHRPRGRTQVRDAFQMRLNAYPATGLPIGISHNAHTRTL